MSSLYQPPGSVLVVGGGLAGASVVTRLREQGFAGRLILAGAEPELPYERPPLSKGYLTGDTARDAVAVHHAGWYDEQEVELLTGTTVADLDLGAGVARTGSGERLDYGAVVLATGARPRRLNIPGADLAGIHYLRSLADAEGLRTELVGGSARVVVIGAGWIGLEVAAAARSLGNAVTVVDPQPTPLHATLGPQMGEVFAALHRQHGVAMSLRTMVRGFRGSGGRLQAVEVQGGEIRADLAVVGIGVEPAVELAAAAGLDLDNGVVTDAGLRASHPGVYAVGDIANAYNPWLGHHVRVEHWENARTTADVAARSIIGQPAAHDVVPYFFTDQFDLGMEYSGHAGSGDFDEVVVRGEPESMEFIAFWLRGGRVLAGMNVNVWDVTPAIQALVRSCRPVDRRRLTDLNEPLEELAAANTASS